jgi:hypothetical protein
MIGMSATSASRISKFLSVISSDCIILQYLHQGHVGPAKIADLAAAVTDGRFCHLLLSGLAIDLGREFIFEVLVDRRLEGVACIAAQRRFRFGFGAVAGRGCGPLPIDPEIIISEQARLGASVVWLGRSYSRADEKLTRSELVNEIRWIRSKFERPGNTEINFRTLQPQVAFWKRLEALAVAS